MSDQVAECEIEKGSPLVGRRLRDIESDYNLRVTGPYDPVRDSKLHAGYVAIEGPSESVLRFIVDAQQNEPELLPKLPQL